jgi:hypothetical protein
MKRKIAISILSIFGIIFLGALVFLEILLFRLNLSTFIVFHVGMIVLFLWVWAVITVTE